jgi:uncharacterized phage protein (TIGR01671 family)
MREIKFRAWDESGKVMVYFILQDLVRAGSNDGRLDDGCRVQDLLDPAVPKMQYTGLKDKTGKPIYEADIVLTEGIKPRLVVWDRFAWFLESPAYQDGINFYYQEAEREFIDATGKVHEIIGNIYENPNLLIDNKPN